MHTFGSSATIDRHVLLAELLKAHAYGSRRITAAKVAARIGKRRVTAGMVNTVAAANASLISTSGGLHLTAAGITAARQHRNPREAVR